MSYSKPILCLDFDGVIHSYSSGWKGVAVIPDKPTPGAMKFIDSALDYFRVHIYSSRSSSLRGRRAMKNWMLTHLTAEYGPRRAPIMLAAIKWPWFKPSAKVTLDDRAVNFDGTFPQVSTLLYFQTWNEKIR